MLGRWVAVVAVAAAVGTVAALVVPPVPADAATVSIGGQVLTASGRPVPGVLVYGWEDAEAKTGSDGRFRITLERGDPRIAFVGGTTGDGAVASEVPDAAGDWYAEYPTGLSGDPGTPVVLRLPPVATWTLTVTRGGSPVPGLLLKPDAWQQFTAPTAPEDYPPGSHTYTWTLTTDTSGQVRMRSWAWLPPRVTISRDLTADCSIRASARWAADHTAVIALPGPEWTPLTVAGRVLTSAGMPAVGVHARLETSGTVDHDAADYTSTLPLVSCTGDGVTDATAGSAWPRPRPQAATRGSIWSPRPGRSRTGRRTRRPGRHRCTARWTVECSRSASPLRRPPPSPWSAGPARRSEGPR